MSTAIQRRRGTTAQHSSFAGLAGELTVDTDKKTVVVHDGTTAGGMPLLPKTMSDGTANGVLYLNGSKVATSGSALTFDGTNLGVGTASPVFSNSGTGLMVNGTTAGTVRVTQGGGTQAGEFRADANNITIGSRTNGSLIFEQFGSESMRLTSTGLGIGTSSPTSKVESYHTSTAPSLSSASGSGLSVRGSSTVRLNFGSDPASPYGAWIQSSDGAGTAYAINLNPLGGNVGIGTSSPSTKLHVAGTVVSNQGVMKVQDLGGSGTSAYPVIALYDAGGTHQGDLGMFAGDQVIANLTASGKILFKTNSTTVGTLDSSGNLGLGVTPSAWDTAYSVLDIGVGGSLFADKATYQAVQLAANTYYATGSYRYKGSRGASSYIQYDGVHKWNVAASGTAGNAISFTQAMTLDASGFLFLGCTTTPSASVKGIRLTPDFTTNTPKFSTGSATGLVYMVEWINGNGIVGSISTNGSATAYNTSSDYRLKDNPQPLTGSGAFIDALQPKTWNWKADGSRGVGFIAHEVQEVSPGSVVGEKDGEQMQAMEYGSAEFIANIIAELQSLRKRLADAGIA